MIAALTTLLNHCNHCNSFSSAFFSPITEKVNVKINVGIRPLENQLSSVPPSSVFRPPNSPALIWAYREGLPRGAYEESWWD
jgi:hypothetical protein